MSKSNGPVAERFAHTPAQASADDIGHARGRAFTEGLKHAAKLVCEYCDEREAPARNEEGVLVHRTFSSRGLGSDHYCHAEAIHIYIESLRGGDPDV